jgi:hypothetical protein
VNEQSVNDNAINQNISQIVPEYVLCECAEKYQLHHTLPLRATSIYFSKPAIALAYIAKAEIHSSNDLTLLGVSLIHRTGLLMISRTTGVARDLARSNGEWVTYDTRFKNANAAEAGLGCFPSGIVH